MFKSNRVGKLASLVTAALLSAQLLGFTPAQATVECANYTETALSTFTIEGTPVTDGSSIVVPNGTTDVDVVATPVDPTSSVMILGDTDLMTGPNDVTAIVDADSGASCTYTVSVQVSLSNDTSLLDLNVFGEDIVANNQVVNAPRGTDVVDVYATPTDENATVEVTGDTGLTGGENEVLITVTAEDGTEETYTVIVLVEESNDATLVELTVEGESIDLNEANPSIDVASGTDAVEVIAVPNDEFATVDVVGDAELVSGSNEITITVTAENGSTRIYTVTVNVALSDDASLSYLTIDEDAVDLSLASPEVTVASGTDAVDVVALPSDINATVDVEGADTLETGNNTVTITVTAEDGTIRVYYVTVIVGLSNDSSIFDLSVDGTDIDFTSSNVVVNVPAGTDAVDVVTTPTSDLATVDVAGADNLEPGDNTVTVIVTAEDGSQTVYTFTVRVLLSNDANLLDLSVDGTDVDFTVSNSVVIVDSGTDAVDVVASPADDSATIDVEGADTLVAGDNTVTVTVTAADGTVRTYTFIVRVLESNDTSLLELTVDGNDVDLNNLSVTVPAGTDAVDVVATPTDENATVDVVGADALEVGDNTVTVTVTAADGTVRTYNLTITVLASDDTSLLELTVDGNDVDLNNLNVTVPAGTDAVDVVATPTDENATVDVFGADALEVGDNIVTVTVTAQDGTVRVYTLTITVLASNDTSLLELTVDGEDINLADLSITVPAGTTSVDVVATPTDENATVEVEGADALEVGVNIVTVTVTAQDGSVRVYTLTITVLASNDTSLLELTVDGEDINLADLSITVPAGTSSVDVVATPTDENATVEVEGADALEVGDNIVTVTVTAQDGTVRVYTLIITVLASSDTSLIGITVDGEDIDLQTLTIHVAPGTTSVDLVATTTDENATVTVEGADGLVVGSNEVYVTVTAQDGTVREYVVTIIVDPSTNTDLFVFEVEGDSVNPGDVYEVEYGTSVVDVYCEAADADATCTVSGNTNLKTGNNTITVTVTAADGVTTKSYTVTVKVLVSDDATLSSLKINGTTVTSGGTFNVANGTTSVTVAATATNANATVAVLGATGLITGNNVVTIKVTAQNGTVVEYTVTVVVAKNDDATLSSIKVNGTSVVAGGTITVANGTTSVTVAATAANAKSTVVVTGTTGLVKGNNVVTIRVTAETGKVVDYTITVVVSKNDDATLSSLKLNGNNVTAGSTVTLPKGTTSVNVAATANSTFATVAVLGATGLVTGNNVVTVKVTAETGKVVDYTITVVVAANNDAWLAVTTAPTVSLGAVAATEGGMAVTSAQASTATNFITSGTGWSANVGVLWLDGKAASLTPTKTISVAAGGSLDIAATGFAPNTEVRIYLGTTLLATLTSDGSGAIKSKVLVPANTPVSALVALTIKGFSSGTTVRQIAIGSAVRAGFTTKVLTVVFKGTATKLDATATKLLATIPKLITGAALVKIDIKGWVAAAKASSATTKIATTRATAVKTQLTKIKVKATVTTGYGGLDKASAKSSKAVVTIQYAKK